MKGKGLIQNQESVYLWAMEKHRLYDSSRSKSQDVHFEERSDGRQDKNYVELELTTEDILLMTILKVKLLLKRLLYNLF